MTYPEPGQQCPVCEQVMPQADPVPVERPLVEQWAAGHDHPNVDAAYECTSGVDPCAKRLYAEAAERVERLEAALRQALRDLGGSHTGHFDRTHGSGKGCEVCIFEREVKAELSALLAETTP